MPLLNLFLGIILLTSCSHPPDLETPCPDYGRFCPQTSINTAPFNKENV